ncbi:UDP-glycosyltransferase UGT5-like [Bacillus rossius redtenbacheri]|uniref:UDP-glycosyltransferase UGT5-like n=1 Tax=Bacillus rossius redtenbacheri TaxID=93214 RepID=UPI002FDD8D46
MRLLLVLAACCSGCLAARVLGLFPTLSRSQATSFTSLMKGLAARGHQVTVVSAFPQPAPLANYTDLDMNIDGDGLYAAVMKGLMARGGDRSWNPEIFRRTLSTLQMTAEMTDMALMNPAFQQLLKSSDSQFDLVVLEAFASDALLGFAHKYNASVVAFCPSAGYPWVLDSVGNPHPPSYVPSVFLRLDRGMSLWQRVVNSLLEVGLKLLREWYLVPQQDRVMRKHFGHLEGLPHVSELQARTSLLLLNSHAAFHPPVPLLPHVVPVGGLHLRPPGRLPKELRRFMDGAQSGVVYCSLGAGLRSADLPARARDALVRVFSRAKQRVLWKYEEALPDQPGNVKTGTWFPQQDVLAHPGLKVFVTSGGLLSLMEAADRGVPVLGLPVTLDQQLNLKRAREDGYAVTVDLANLTEHSLARALGRLLRNPRYRRAAQERSRLLRDQPLSPLERAVWWTEYALRHEGMPHLRSAVLHLGWAQSLLLDVAGLALGSGLLGVALAWHLLRRRLSVERRAPTTTNTQSQRDSSPSGLKKKGDDDRHNSQ